MSAKKLKPETLFPLLSLLSVLFIQYYELSIYERHINLLLDTLYANIAIPCFYFFLGASVALAVLPFLNMRVPKRVRSICNYVVTVSLAFYGLLVALKITGMSQLPFIAFFSMYALMFAGLGCLLSIGMRRDK